jgi:hypothetical protein
VPEIYDHEHLTKIVKVSLGDALENLMRSMEILEAISEMFCSKVVNYLAVDCDFYEAGKCLSRSFEKIGSPDSLLEHYEPAVAGINSAMIAFQSCFHKWADGRKPPGLTQHAVLYITTEIEGAKYSIRQLYDIVFDRMNGLVDALREIEIRAVTEG